MTTRATLERARREADPATASATATATAVGSGVAIAAILLIGIGLAWAAAVPDNALFGTFAPGPVFARLQILWSDPAFWTATGSTLGFAASGFAAAMIVGALGALMYRAIPQQGRALAPVMILLQAFPTAALLPLIVLFFGVGAPLGLVFAFGLVVLPAVQTLRLATYAEGRGATACAGLFGLALAGAVAGEYVAGQAGLGARLIRDVAAFETAAIGAMVVHLWLVALIGGVIVAGIAVLLLRALRRV